MHCILLDFTWNFAIPADLVHMQHQATDRLYACVACLDAGGGGGGAGAGQTLLVHAEIF